MRDRFWMWVAWHCPKRLVYWCALRLFGYATIGVYSSTVVPNLTVQDALKRWEDHL